MPESTESQANKKPAARSQARRAVFIPQPMGVLILVIIVLAFILGIFRQELALMLTGAVFLLPWIYSLCMTLFLALIHYHRTQRAYIRVSPHEVTTGGAAEALYAEKDRPESNIMQLPGIVVRCRLSLETKDGRRLQHDLNPVDSAPMTNLFVAEKRGAYFSIRDEFAIFDIFGFFRFAYRLPCEPDVRLLVNPRAADTPLAVHARAGESHLSPELSFQRTDNFIDHRPYVPGDDPRRINWKLYGHGGWLFVREGEREPPPHSNIVILIDTECDPRLYNVSAARDGIDTLCRHALAMTIVCAESGMEALTGYPGGPLRPGNAAAFAWPAALPLCSSADLPAVPDDFGVVILALPRSGNEAGALDRFLYNHTRPLDVLFFCGDFTGGPAPDKCRTIVREPDSLETARFVSAEACAALYNRRPGVRAKVVGV